ncbi:MAG TPA: GNAT family N-acetyltransferase [Chthoniobacteraceae bacterium]|nr:GNAT family N-acetyltransferase [Chthoniobacteraceae bacterium]
MKPIASPSPSLPVGHRLRAVDPGIRPATASEYEELVAWLNGIFHPHCPDFFQTRYCHLFRGGAAMEQSSLVIEEEGRYLGHIGLYVFGLRTSVGPLRTGGIGCVAVAPEARGRGIARRLLDAAHHKALEEGCVIGLLGGIRSIYGSAGYEICGLRYQWMWDRQRRKPAQGWRRVAPETAAEIVHPLWKRARHGVLWEPEIFAQLPLRTGWETWVDGANESYTFVQVGQDLVLVDHFHVAETGFQAMMDAISHHYLKPVQLHHPAGDAFLHAEMTRSGMDPRRMSQGMLKILNAAALGERCHNKGLATGPHLAGIAGHELSHAPDTVARQRLASRKVFGDPFESGAGQPGIRWGWEDISHI